MASSPDPLVQAQASLAAGDLPAAEAAIDRRLEMAFRDVGALLLKGLLRERAGDLRAATTFYTAALAQAEVDGGMPPPLIQLADHARAAMARAQSDFAAHLDHSLGDLPPRVQEAVELLRGTRELYFQQPSVLYFPGLPQRRFYEASEFDWLAGVLAAIPAMQAELAAVVADGDAAFAPYIERPVDRPAPNNPLLESSDWGAFYFWRNGAPVGDAAARCPATMAALALAPMPRIPGRSPNALWSRLKPGTHIRPHVGMLNTRLICHVPIKTAPACTLRVGSETREWIDEVPLIFDDSIEHEARNDGPADRVVLLFEIWRPEVTPEERDGIAAILGAVESYGIG
jgi:hypothetical protein